MSLFSDNYTDNSNLSDVFFKENIVISVGDSGIGQDEAFVTDYDVLQSSALVDYASNSNFTLSPATQEKLPTLTLADTSVINTYHFAHVRHV